MLGSKIAAAALAVSDLERAREFYESTLGLGVAQDDQGGILFTSGDSLVFVYESEYAGTNKATAAVWAAGADFDAVVGELGARGVRFEHYDDLPGVTRDGDVHTMGEIRGVWFADPDGNVLNVIDQMA